MARPRRQRIFETANDRLRRGLVPPAAPWAPAILDLPDPRFPRYRPKPVVMGARAVKPLLLAKWRDGKVSDGAGLIVVLKTFGPGPLQISNLRLGSKTLISGRVKAAGRQKGPTTSPIPFWYELVEGRAGDPGLTMFPLALDAAFPGAPVPTTDSNSFAKWSGSVLTPPTTTTVETVVTFPNGLSKKRTSAGQTYWGAVNCTLTVCARPIGSSAAAGDSGTWSQSFRVLGFDDTLPIEVVVNLDLDPDPTKNGYKKGWEVRCRISNVSGSAPDPAATFIRCISGGPKAPGKVPGYSAIVVELPASASSDPSLPDLEADVQAERNAWTGAAWGVQLSRNPAAAFREVLQGMGNPRPLADARLDLTSLQTWAADCDSRGFKFDFTFGQDGGQGEIDAALRMICAAGRASLSRRDGLWGVAREPNPATALPSGHFCPRNAWGFRAPFSYVPPFHGARCSFKNVAKAYADDAVLVFSPGYNADGSGGNQVATRFESWNFDGVVEQGQVEKLGAYRIAVELARAEPVEFSTSWQQMAVTRGDVVRVATDLLKDWGLGQARVKEVPSTKRLLLDEAVTMAVGGTYEVRVIKSDGTSAVYPVVTVPGEWKDISTTAVHGAAPDDLIFFGETGKESMACVVLKVEQAGDLGAKITVAPLGSGIYDAGAGSTADSGSVAPAALSKPTFLDVQTKGDVVVTLSGK
jgi:hypothetical protein